MALDFFTAETVLLRTLYVLFAIHIATRRVMILGVSRNPDSAWVVSQQARNLAVGERLHGIRFASRDRDSKFSGPFDEVLRSEDVRVMKTRSDPREPTLTPSGGSAPPGRSAWTGSWYSAAATSSECSAPTPPTTTGPGPTEA